MGQPAVEHCMYLNITVGINMSDAFPSSCPDGSAILECQRRDAMVWKTMLLANDAPVIAFQNMNTARISWTPGSSQHHFALRIKVNSSGAIRLEWRQVRGPPFP